MARRIEDKSRYLIFCATGLFLRRLGRTRRGYAPSRVIMEQLFDRIVPGGLLVLDDYGTVYGETKAVDEFLKKKGLALRLEKLPFYKIPVFLVKE